ncbi:MBL fold metallo-hydrolase [Nocardioides sp. zg-536]|uniref:MBL fold metallo-hydrolase n=1 Tax=Nocardioides faecalis TaxID=2803858 RepID=A0A938Y897_9ACTN|nr:MBL fold metallo-hydrolase [Nocardioides faecalis]MBM9461105.1 MBL fold metallo-hydrolase [Nocardioides faecalis]MBS4751990.1 MBL fold metallo-hydrolase [Nocardioides faecalis]QVI59183.1 MBL fold metallo-hydrolase [Nocardioides faecalis]
MRLTKFGHAAVRITHEDTTVVLDPGAWSEREAVEGADAVLITHEHADHYHPDHLRATDAPIYTIGAVAAQIRESAPDIAERVTVVSPEETWQLGSIGVKAIGELHAVIHPEMPRFNNSGYLFTLGDTTVFHPGDALTGPGVPVDVLLAPVSAPWMRASEGIDFARSVGAARNVAIHDAVYSPEGLGFADGLFGRLLGARDLDYVRLASGSDL